MLSTLQILQGQSRQMDAQAIRFHAHFLFRLSFTVYLSNDQLSLPFLQSSCNPSNHGVLALPTPPAATAR